MSFASSDSDSGNNPPRIIFPHLPPPPPPPPKPKKKKKNLPPQETINKIWSRFSVPKFSKATQILPLTTPAAKRSASKVASAPPLRKPERDNLLVSEDFDRAVAECRTRVKKLIRECRRVNMRYRDPDFDIDWDLKWEKGYCLNGLGDRKFEISGRAFANPTSNVPKAVKRVHEIFDKPTFLKDKVSPADVKQGNLGDCWLMASLTALANMEVGLQRICVEYDTKVGIYGFVFHRDGEWIISIIDDKLYLKSPDWDSPSVQRHLLEQTDREDVEKEYRKTYQTGSQALFFAHCRDPNETWLPLLEKAYAKAHGDYAALAGGWIGEGVEDLTGGITTELLTSDILDTDEFWNNEIRKVNKEFLFGCSTGLLDGGYGTREGISEGHAYVIMEARELSTGERLLKLRNPWGKGKKGIWEGAWSDGSKEFTPEAQLELKHKFGSDSVFWISYQDLLRKYQHFDRTRLFMDSPDWRLTQKWISVEVPWKAEFEQRFRIVLEKESPVVLVLGQLDDRYFDGLQGQYRYRLQFRLHEVNSPGEEDYVVRSHGNYLMERSVVAELKSLEPGIYSVFILVAADRDTSAPSVEDVVKTQTKKKVDNDKLAQVGVSYDLAHSKAAVHMESMIAARKAADKAKARKARMAARRKNWEKRQLSREIVRKQEKKNKEKRDAKSAKEKADAKEKAEKKPKDRGMQTEEIKEVEISKEHKAVQTEDSILSSTESEKTVLQPSSPASSQQNETDKAVQTDNMSASFTSHEIPTPKSSTGIPDPRPVIVPNPRRRSRVRHIPSDVSDSDVPGPPLVYVRERERRMSGPPPPMSYRHPAQSMAHQRQVVPQYIVTSEGESSASPISDFDDMYSDDDPTLKPRPAAGGVGQVPNGPGGGPSVPGKKKDDSEDEDDVEAWNAVCIVGFRVYSQDENLKVFIYEEGMDEIQGTVVPEGENGTDGDVEDAGDTAAGKSAKKEARVEETSPDVGDNGEMKETVSKDSDVRLSKEEATSSTNSKGCEQTSARQPESESQNTGDVKEPRPNEEGTSSTTTEDKPIDDIESTKEEKTEIRGPDTAPSEASQIS